MITSSNDELLEATPSRSRALIVSMQLVVLGVAVDALAYLLFRRRFLVGDVFSLAVSAIFVLGGTYVMVFGLLVAGGRRLRVKATAGMVEIGTPLGTTCVAIDKLAGVSIGLDGNVVMHRRDGRPLEVQRWHFDDDVEIQAFVAFVTLQISRHAAAV